MPRHTGARRPTSPARRAPGTPHPRAARPRPCARPRRGRGAPDSGAGRAGPDRFRDVTAQIPVTPSLDGDYVVDSSVLHPEPGVLEYPRGGGYPYENWDWDPIVQLDEQLGYRADCALFTAPGTKVGGWPGFCQDPYWPEREECGQRPGGVQGRRYFARLLSFSVAAADSLAWWR